MGQITRRAVCMGLVAVPAVAAAGIRPSTALGSVQYTTAAVASPDVIGRVIEIVSQHENIPAEILLSPLRTRQAVAARRKALYLGYRLSRKSLTEIGFRFGGRDPTTVLYAVRATEARILAEASLRAELLLLTDRVDAFSDQRLAVSVRRLRFVLRGQDQRAQADKLFQA